MRRTIAKNVTRTLAGQWGQAKVSFINASQSDCGIIIRYARGGMQRVDLHSIKVGFRNIQLNVHKGSIKVIEHVLAALVLKSITDLIVELDARWSAFPSLVDSIEPFLQMIDEAGVEDYEQSRLEFRVMREDKFFEWERGVYITPCHRLEVRYNIDFPHVVKDHYLFRVGIDDCKEISMARPLSVIHRFIPLPEKVLQKFSDRFLMAQGEGIDEYRNAPRYQGQEAVRHKVIDFLGAIGCLGHRTVGQFHVVKGGHAIDIAALQYFVQNGSLKAVYVQ